MDDFMLKRKFKTLSDDSSGDDGVDGGAPETKKPMYANSSLYSDQSLRMMQRMGFRADAGLGKSGQGRLEPIEASAQKGRRGLGLRLDGLDMAADSWRPELETIELREPVDWIQDYSADLETKSFDDFRAWMVESPKKLTIDDESAFCDPTVLANVLAQKSVFDQLGADDMRNARTRCNPFETIGSSIFMNRAAVKMANMDAMFEFMFTTPKDEDGNPTVGENDLLYFADCCAGPGMHFANTYVCVVLLSVQNFAKKCLRGQLIVRLLRILLGGFSEYVLWKKGWHAKGFGFTLKCENDFKLEKFLAGTPETFDTYYGCKDDGNIFDPENIESLTEHVLSQTMSGVHFMMSDGGFSVEGQENVQEILSKQLYLCQCLTALSIVRVNGHFVTKLFDLFTPFSVGLVYLMYKCFKQVCIVKPNTSRPANSERYLVCKWKKPNTDSIRGYMFEVNQYLFDNANTDDDVVELVPLDVMRDDDIFFNYICDSNNAIGHNQAIALMKIAHYCKDTNLRDARQEEFKIESLKLWRIPNAMRKASVRQPPEQLFTALLGGWQDQRELIDSADRLVSAQQPLHDTFYDPDDWLFVPIDVVQNAGKTIRTFFMSRGNGDVYKYTDQKCWAPLTEIFVEIPPKSLFYGEIAKELNGEGGAQTMVYALHIIDAIMLGGMDVRSYKLSRRLRLCRTFADALNKPQRKVGASDQQCQLSAAVRAKRLYNLMELREFFGKLEARRLKNNQVRLGLRIHDPACSSRFYVPRGIMVFKNTKTSLRKRFDPQSQEYVYTDYANPQKPQHFWLKGLKDVNVIYGSFRSTFGFRKLWKWDVPNQVAESFEEITREPDLVYRTDFERFLYGE